MPANVNPIFPITPKIGSGKVLTANTATDGTGTTVEVFVAGANGAKIDQIKVRPLGTNIATVLRFFVNNGAVPTTAANNTLIHEETMAATTISQVAALADKDVLIAKGSDSVPPIPYLPAGYKILVAVGTTIAAGLQVTVHGGDY